MKDIHSIQHDLKRDVYNIMNLLKFIKNEEDIKDPEIRSMLEMVLEREKVIFEKVITVSNYLKRDQHEV
jgi:hypothetical protein